MPEFCWNIRDANGGCIANKYQRTARRDGVMYWKKVTTLVTDGATLMKRHLLHARAQKQVAAEGGYPEITCIRHGDPAFMLADLCRGNKALESRIRLGDPSIVLAVEDKGARTQKTLVALMRRETTNMPSGPEVWYRPLSILGELTFFQIDNLTAKRAVDWHDIPGTLLHSVVKVRSITEWSRTREVD